MTYGLIDVCNKMLDNADMVLDLSSYPSISMSFIVHGSVDDSFWEVFFQCDETISLNIENDNDLITNDLHMVLEVNVLAKPLERLNEKISVYLNEPKPELIWFINIYGDASLNLICGKFNWELKELSELQYKAKFA